MDKNHVAHPVSAQEGEITPMSLFTASLRILGIPAFAFIRCLNRAMTNPKNSLVGLLRGISSNKLFRDGNTSCMPEHSNKTKNQFGRSLRCLFLGTRRS